MFARNCCYGHSTATLNTPHSSKTSSGLPLLSHTTAASELVAGPKKLLQQIIHPADQNGFNPLNPELNPICYFLALLGAHQFLHVSRIRVKSLNLGLLMSYIYIYIYIYIQHIFLMFLDHTQRRSTVGRTPLDE